MRHYIQFQWHELRTVYPTSLVLSVIRIKLNYILTFFLLTLYLLSKYLCFIMLVVNLHVCHMLFKLRIIEI